jgi:tetratricopeptide (TPR) repeat protein
VQHRLSLRIAGSGWGLLVLLVLGAVGCVKRPVDYEREYARTLAPKKLEGSTSAPPSGPRRTLRVRVYADADYRAQVLRWDRSIEAQLRRASAVVEGSLGVVFEVDSAKHWERPGSSENLDVALNQLEALDPGEDVDLVIGLVSALPIFSATHHELGRARVFGRHCVLRGMENPQEAQALIAMFKHLPDAEREALYRERKLHKETSVLLHEWAHTLGAFHVQDSQWMMHPGYDSSQAAFAPRTLGLLGLSLRHVPRARRSLEAQQDWARELKAMLSATVWPDWEGPDKAWVLEWTEHVLAGKVPLGRERETPLAPADARRLDEVFALDKEGRVEVAAQQLEPLARRYPLDERVQVMACYLAVRTAPKLPATRERCESTVSRFPNQHPVLMNLAALHFQAGNTAEGQAYLLEARERLESKPETPPEHWAHLAELFRNASCVTWAEQAAAKAPGTQEATQVLAWATQTRRWKALPPEPERSGVGAEREGDFIRAVKALESRMDQGGMGQVRAQLAALSRDYPRAPMVQVLQCELHLQTGQVGPARTACRKALALHEESVQAHFILGWLAANARTGEEARKHFERVIDLEPTHSEAWKMLAEQYRSAGKARELKDLQERYRARFSRELR